MASRADYEKKMTEFERGVLDKGLPPINRFPLLQSQLEFTRWKESKQGPVLALMPDGTGLISPGWVAELEKRRIGQLMAAERTSGTRENLNDLFGGLAYGAGSAWGWDADRLSDVGATFSPLQFAPVIGLHPLNQQSVVGAPSALRNAVYGSSTYQRSERAPQRPTGAPSPENRPSAPPSSRVDGSDLIAPKVAKAIEQARGTTNRLKGPDALVQINPAAPKTSSIKRASLPSSTLPEYASENSFMGAMRRRLLNQRRDGKPSLLDFLLGSDGDWRKGEFTSKSGRLMRGRYSLSAPDKPLVQAGHLEAKTYSKAAGKPREFLMLEDADLNWLSGQLIETKGAYSSKGAVLIDGYPVDIRTAKLYEKHGLLPAGTVDAAPIIEPPPFF
jgi:Bacterial toxin 5